MAQKRDWRHCVLVGLLVAGCVAALTFVILSPGALIPVTLLGVGVGMLMSYGILRYLIPAGKRHWVKHKASVPFSNWSEGTLTAELHTMALPQSVLALASSLPASEAGIAPQGNANLPVRNMPQPTSFLPLTEGLSEMQTLLREMNFIDREEVYLSWLSSERKNTAQGYEKAVKLWKEFAEAEADETITTLTLDCSGVGGLTYSILPTAFEEWIKYTQVTEIKLVGRYQEVELATVLALLSLDCCIQDYDIEEVEIIEAPGKKNGVEKGWIPEWVSSKFERLPSWAQWGNKAKAQAYLKQLVKRNRHIQMLWDEEGLKAAHLEKPSTESWPSSSTTSTEQALMARKDPLALTREHLYKKIQKLQEEMGLRGGDGVPLHVDLFGKTWQCGRIKDMTRRFDAWLRQKVYGVEEVETPLSRLNKAYNTLGAERGDSISVIRQKLSALANETGNNLKRANLGEEVESSERAREVLEAYKTVLAHKKEEVGVFGSEEKLIQHLAYLRKGFVRHISSLFKQYRIAEMGGTSFFEDINDILKLFEAWQVNAQTLQIHKNRERGYPRIALYYEAATIREHLIGESAMPVYMLLNHVHMALFYSYRLGWINMKNAELTRLLGKVKAETEEERKAREKAEADTEQERKLREKAEADAKKAEAGEEQERKAREKAEADAKKFKAEQTIIDAIEEEEKAAEIIENVEKGYPGLLRELYERKKDKARTGFHNRLKAQNLLVFLREPYPTPLGEASGERDVAEALDSRFDGPAAGQATVFFPSGGYGGDALAVAEIELNAARPVSPTKQAGVPAPRIN